MTAKFTRAAALLREIADDQVYRVRQRTATYAVNNRTGRRVTRDLRPLEADGLVRLSDRSRDGLSRQYELTDAGRAAIGLPPVEAPPVEPDTAIDEEIWAGVVRGKLDQIEAAALARGEAPAAPVSMVPAEAPAVAAAAIAAAPLVPRGEVERSTGAIRDPRKFVDWTAAVKAAVLAAPAPAAGPVVGVIVNMRCAVVGPFESPAAARDWWDVDYNRLRQGSAQFAIWPAPAAPRPEPVRAVVAPGWHSEEAGQNVLARLRASKETR